MDRRLKALLIFGCLIAAVAVVTHWLKPPPSVTGPYVLAVFFQFQMNVYVREHMANPPPAFTVFTWAAFAGMIFVYAFPALVWYRLGFVSALGVVSTGVLVITVWTLALRGLVAGGIRDLQMIVDFLGLIVMPLAAALAVYRLFALAPGAG